jgi:hypothetical protein
MRLEEVGLHAGSRPNGVSVNPGTSTIRLASSPLGSLTCVRRPREDLEFRRLGLAPKIETLKATRWRDAYFMVHWTTTGVLLPTLTVIG